MKKLTFLFFALFLFSCCPEKKKDTQPKEETKTNKVVEVDYSRLKTIFKEKESDIKDEEIEWLFEGDWGPV